MDLRESLINQTDVCLSLAKHVISMKGKDCNLVLSPMSIQVLLGIIAAGSKGPTRDQVLCFLKSKSVEEQNMISSHLVSKVFCDGASLGGPRLSFANGVWIHHSLTLKPAFKTIIDDDYKAVSNYVDFQTKAIEVIEAVNTWANKETNGLIKEIVSSDSVDANTRLILANALYFKGSWNQKFDASKTKDHDFFLSNGSSTKVPFMTSENKQYIGSFDGFKVLRLPYEQGEDKRVFSLYVFLPDMKNGLPDLLEKICSESGFIDHHLPRCEVEVGDFRIPKFKIGFGFEASDVLKRLRLVLPFNGGGLTEMVESSSDCRNLSVSGVIHKSYIEVNEEGTEAAAISIIVCMPLSLWIEKAIDFVANHPFVFVLREDTTGVVFFIGQVVDPSC